MKFNKWTLALAAAGVVSIGSVAQAEEAQHQVMTALSQTTLSGYVDTTASWMIGTGSGPLPGRIYDGAAKQDGFNLNVVNVTLEKALDEGAWSAGYKAQLLFGPDAVFYNTSPLNFGGGDVSLKDAYVSLRAPVGNGLDVKVGSFATVTGYEVFEGPNNPNYGRSYGWQLEATQHTGVLASYQLTESIGISAGVANTHNTGLNTRPARLSGPAAETEKTYLGSIVFVAPESFGFLAGSTLYGAIVDGLTSGGSAQNTTSWYAGATIPTPVEGLALGVAYDYVEDFTGTAAAANNRAYALAGYVSFQATEKMRVNGRVDYTNADDGIWTSANGAHDELLGVTATLDYTLWANVLSRAEVRWDHSTNGEGVFNRGEKNAVTVAANIVYKF